MKLLKQQDNRTILDLEEFKSNYKLLTWYYIPRVLTEDHKDFFFVAEYEDEDYETKLMIKPTMEISITETYKHCNESGAKVDREYTGRKFKFGEYVEIRITEELLGSIREMAIEKPKIVRQIVSI